MWGRICVCAKVLRENVMGKKRPKPKKGGGGLSSSQAPERRSAQAKPAPAGKRGQGRGRAVDPGHVDSSSDEESSFEDVFTRKVKKRTRGSAAHGKRKPVPSDSDEDEDADDEGGGGTRSSKRPTQNKAAQRRRRPVEGDDDDNDEDVQDSKTPAAKIAKKKTTARVTTVASRVRTTRRKRAQDPSDSDNDNEEGDLAARALGYDRADEEEEAFVANPDLKGQEALDEYFSTKKALASRPSEVVLDFFDRDPRVARLMLHERTGFDLDNASHLLDRASCKDKPTRDAARLELRDLYETLGPDLAEKNDIRDTFYEQGGDHEQLLQVCACCGVKDFAIVQHGKHYPLNDSWCNMPFAQNLLFFGIPWRFQFQQTKNAPRAVRLEAAAKHEATVQRRRGGIDIPHYHHFKL